MTPNAAKSPLVAGGCGLREAARRPLRHQHHSPRGRANPEFDEQLRRSEMYAQTQPIAGHATRRRHALAGSRVGGSNELSRPLCQTRSWCIWPAQARELLSEVLSVISSENRPLQIRSNRKTPPRHVRILHRAACDRRRTARGLRRAMKFFDDKNTRRNRSPSSASQCPISILNELQSIRSAEASQGGKQPAESSSPPAARRRSMDDVLEELRERVSNPNPAEPTRCHPIRHFKSQ